MSFSYLSSYPSIPRRCTNIWKDPGWDWGFEDTVSVKLRKCTSAPGSLRHGESARDKPNPREFRTLSAIRKMEIEATQRLAEVKRRRSSVKMTNALWYRLGTESSEWMVSQTNKSKSFGQLHSILSRVHPSLTGHARTSAACSLHWQLLHCRLLDWVKAWTAPDS